MRRRGVLVGDLDQEGLRVLLDSAIECVEAAERAAVPASESRAENDTARDLDLSGYSALFDEAVGEGRAGLAWVAIASVAILGPVAVWLPVLLMS
jgi:hypothetical protein